ncbi:MAG TPA: dihydrolipoamide acetyltransferase family protein [Anaeromyxobacteraceae bacterium]|nr:dihydrolipoamide acetyltransferase family protein [Anaeromyxobacteraceae bacterium]
MAFQLILPDIGEGVVEAEIQQWFVKPGDEVAEDQPLVEVMTDKATVTIPSPRRGRVTKLFWKEGDVAKVHEPLLELEVEAGQEAGGGQASPSGRGHSDSAAAMREGAAPSATSGQASPSGRGQSDSASAMRGEGPSTVARRKALATPAVRAAARQMGVDIDAVVGTGPGGRVTKDDLARGGGNGHGTAAWVAPAATARPAAAGQAPAEERIPLRGVRRRIAEKMALSKRTAAHFTFVDQVDVTELARAKETIAAAAREEGVRVTFLPFVVKAALWALKRFPQLNASLDEEKQEIVLKRHYDIGIASATEGGLLVPVVRAADRLSLLDLAREIERLAQDSKAGKASPEDQGGSTFTVTSLGALGGLFATPVINYPEVAILGIHAIRPTPVAREGQVVVRDVMHVSLTSDHRVVDGHLAAAFTAEVIRLLEEPSLLFMRMV